MHKNKNRVDGFNGNLRTFAVLLILAAIVISGCTGKKDGVLSAQALERLNTLQAKADNVKYPNTPAPEFNLTDIDGREISRESLLGSNYILQAYASWCFSCIEEAQRLDVAYQQFKDKGLKVVYVSTWIDETPDTVRDFVNASKVRSDWYWNTVDTDLLTNFEIYITDATRLVNSEGMIVYSDDGATSTDKFVHELNNAY